METLVIKVKSVISNEHCNCSITPNVNDITDFTIKLIHNKGNHVFKNIPVGSYKITINDQSIDINVEIDKTSYVIFKHHIDRSTIKSKLIPHDAHQINLLLLYTPMMVILY